MTDCYLCSSEIDWLIENDGFLKWFDFDECYNESEFVSSDQSEQNFSENGEEIHTVPSGVIKQHWWRRVWSFKLFCCFYCNLKICI